MTQIEFAKKNIITKEMREVAKYERVSAVFIRNCVANGTIVILKNNRRKSNTKFRVVGIGRNLKIKVNANIGTSPMNVDIRYEKQKVLTAIILLETERARANVIVPSNVRVVFCGRHTFPPNKNSTGSSSSSSFTFSSSSSSSTSISVPGGTSKGKIHDSAARYILADSAARYILRDDP